MVERPPAVESDEGERHEEEQAIRGIHGLSIIRVISLRASAHNLRYVKLRAEEARTVTGAVSRARSTFTSWVRGRPYQNRVSSGYQSATHSSTMRRPSMAVRHS